MSQVMDVDLPIYYELNDYLKYPIGEIRFPTVRFYYLALEVAMKNAHHDEPGFWKPGLRIFEVNNLLIVRLPMIF